MIAVIADIPTPTYTRDKAGFPLVECGRCRNTGRMPYSYAGGVCFGCTGTGWVPPKGKAGDLRAEWIRIAKRAATVDTAVRVDTADGRIICDLRPGDQVRNTYGLAPADAKLVPWKTVERVDIGDLNGGCTLLGSAENGTQRCTSLTLAAMITFTDGTTRHAGALLDRKVDPAIYEQRDALAAQARKLHERTLTNRARRTAA
jgi:hypothetical protein